MEHMSTRMDSEFNPFVHFGREQTYVWDDAFALGRRPPRQVQKGMSSKPTVEGGGLVSARR